VGADFAPYHGHSVWGMAFAWSGVTVAKLVLFFGYYALVDSIFSLFTGLSGRRRDDRAFEPGRL
jgi:hypothetical protein